MSAPTWGTGRWAQSGDLIWFRSLGYRIRSRREAKAMWFIDDNEQRRDGSIERLPAGPGRTTTVCCVPAPHRCTEASPSSLRLASGHCAHPAEPDSVPGLDPGIGADMCVHNWSERGAVHAYVTSSEGSERAQMVRDLSVNWKGVGWWTIHELSTADILQFLFPRPSGGFMKLKGFARA